MEILVALIMSGFFALICGVIADGKGRSARNWALGGFLFGIFTLIVLLCMPNMNNYVKKEAEK